MHDRTLEAYHRFCRAFELSETEGSFVKRLMEEIAEQLIVNEEEREGWIEELGFGMVELLGDLVDEVGLYLLYCAYEGFMEPGEPPLDIERGWYEGEFRTEMEGFESLLRDPDMGYRLRKARYAKLEAFREGKQVALSGIDGEFLSLVEKLKERHSYLTFTPSNEFKFSWEGFVVRYVFPTEMEDRVTDYPLEEAEVTLLHEAGHGVFLEKYVEEYLEESGEEPDVDFLPFLVETTESEAWEIAWQEAEALGLSQNPEFKEAFEKRRERGEESHAESVYRNREDKEREKDWLDWFFYG